jgi:hypothetical protein
MRIAFPGRRPTRGRQTAESIDIGDWNARGDDGLTQIKRPDGLKPLDHPHTDDQPVRKELMGEVNALVDELAVAGGLDGGTDDALDYWIDDRVAQWRSAVEQESSDRRTTALRLLAAHEQFLEEEERALRYVEELREAATADEHHYRARLHGLEDRSTHIRNGGPAQ